VRAHLEEVDVIVGIAVVAAPIRLIAMALVEAAAAARVHILWSMGEDDLARTLPWQLAQRRAHLPLEVAALVVPGAGAVHVAAEDQQDVAVRPIAANTVALGAAVAAAAVVPAVRANTVVEAEQRRRRA